MTNRWPEDPGIDLVGSPAPRFTPEWLPMPADDTGIADIIECVDASIRREALSTLLRLSTTMESGSRALAETQRRDHFAESVIHGYLAAHVWRPRRGE